MIKVSYAQVSTNGLISFGTSYNAYSPSPFPIQVPVVAAYWTDIHTSNGGVIFNILNATFLQNINNLISSQVGISFTGTFALRVRWDNVCPYSNQSCINVSIITWTTYSENNLYYPQTNTFEAVLVTNGTLSYTILTYRCGDLNWASSDTVIGFSASQCFYANNSYSGPNVNDIACANQLMDGSNSVVYQISGGETTEIQHKPITIYPSGPSCPSPVPCATNSDRSLVLVMMASCHHQCIS